MKKGRKYINKDGINKVVYPEDLQQYLDAGWSLGNTKASNKGMKAWNKGLTKETSESVAKISASKIGISRNLETRQKLSEAHKGKILSDETRNKISLANNGHSVSEQTKRKISEANTGHKVSDETRMRISQAMQGRTHTEETRKKISQSLTGTVRTQEYKDNLSAIHKNPDFQAQLNATKLQNHTFNTSSPEELYYQSLVQIYGEEDVCRQYRDERYPFSCDFYIKSLDLFIELNLHWTHGGHPYNSDNIEDVRLAEDLKLKGETSEYYRNAYYVWTDLDVRKQSIAKLNGLNYKVVYKL